MLKTWAMVFFLPLLYHNKWWKIDPCVFFPRHAFCLLSDSHCRFMTPNPTTMGGLKRRPAVILSDSSFSLSLWPWQPVTVRRGTRHKVAYRLLFFESLSLAHKNGFVGTQGNLQRGGGCERYSSMPHWMSGALRHWLFGPTIVETVLHFDEINRASNVTRSGEMLGKEQHDGWISQEKTFRYGARHITKAFDSSFTESLFQCELMSTQMSTITDARKDPKDPLLCSRIKKKLKKLVLGSCFFPKLNWVLLMPQLIR